MQGCSKQAKARAYTALVRPHLETCSLVWTPYQRGALDDLEKVQNSVARWICAKWDNANYCWTKTYEECCYELNWATVHQRHLLLTCCQAYKIVNNMDSLRFEDYFQSCTKSHGLILCCASSRVNAYTDILHLPFLWNTIPFNISTSYGAFKSKL